MARAAKKETLLTTEEKLAKALVPEEEQPYPVPGNWCWGRLGGVAQWTSGGTPSRKCSQYYTGKIPWVKTGELNDSFLYDTEEKITEEAVRNSSAKVMPIHTVILAMYGATIGKTAILGIEATTNQACACAIPTKAIDYKFLFYYLRSQKEGFITQSQGGAQPNISQSIIKKYPIPFPPFSEQQRIVTLIESLFADLDAAKDKLQAVLDGFAKRRAALLHKAFTGELTREWREEHRIGNESWIETPSAELFEYVTSGSRGWAQYYADTGAIFLRIGNLDHGTIELDISDIQHVDLPDKAEGQRSRVKKGDILISITADVGMIAYIKEEIEEAYINQHIALARPKKANDSEFIAWYFVSDVGLNQLQHMQRGTTKVGLTLQDIKSVYLKMPCLEEQKEIVRILDDIFAKESQSKAAVESALAKIDTMKKAILATAFRGGFETNNSSDESAKELLRKVL